MKIRTARMLTYVIQTTKGSSATQRSAGDEGSISTRGHSCPVPGHAFDQCFVGERPGPFHGAPRPSRGRYLIGAPRPDAPGGAGRGTRPSRRGGAGRRPPLRRRPCCVGEIRVRCVSLAGQCINEKKCSLPKTRGTSLYQRGRR